MKTAEFPDAIATQRGQVPDTLVAMPRVLMRIIGVLMLTGAISVSSCQAAFQLTSGLEHPQENAPQQLSPGSFER